MNKLSVWDDTIVALATPPGVGAIGVIRLSGKRSITIANAIFPSKDLQDLPSHTLHVGFLMEGDRIIDEVVLSLYKSPRSYTGEDVVEISSHGSPYVQQEVIAVCIRQGARLAKPGEFTQRAFLNGKLDLAQAEAVADLIASNTAASQKAALHTIRGGFSENLKVLRDRLLTFSALIELELDFSQEDVEFADRAKFYELIRELTSSTQQLVNSFSLGNVIKNGVSVAIIGKPNAGKSTLLNSLLNENRAIVSEIPGTTRDTIEELINIDGILFRLIDTAGIREHTTDIIESAGIERTMDKMEKADLVLLMIDATSLPHITSQRQDDNTQLATVNPQLTTVNPQPTTVNPLPVTVNPELVEGWLKEKDIQYLIIVNKIDEVDEQNTRTLFTNDKTIFISAKKHLHLETLKERMVDTVLQGTIHGDQTVVTNARHYHALKEVEKSLLDIKNGLDNKLSGDLLALDIRRCLHYLGEITGEITNEDQLDYIFSKFCIGK